MKDPVPGKRRLLTQMALFWFDKLHALVPKHLTGESPDTELAALGQQRTAAAERALLSGTALQRERVYLILSAASTCRAKRRASNWPRSEPTLNGPGLRRHAAYKRRASGMQAHPGLPSLSSAAAGISASTGTALCKHPVNSPRSVGPQAHLFHRFFRACWSAIDDGQRNVIATVRPNGFPVSRATALVVRLSRRLAVR
jgi:hypothetical protein